MRQEAQREQSGRNTLQFPPEVLESIRQEAQSEGYQDASEYLGDLHGKHKAESCESAAGGAGDNERPQAAPDPVIVSSHGEAYCGDSAALMPLLLQDNSVDLVMTSPPYGLVRKKDYGNEDAERYVAWFEQFASEFVRVLKPRGSLVIDIGSAWKRGIPARSLYQYELLIMLCRKFGFELAQDFFWWNPSKLPTPAEWVAVRRIRVKDAVNCIWWLGKTAYPKVSNKRVLQPYSSSMRALLQNGYKPKLRPSGHNISGKFRRDNKGSIPPNLLALANTESNGSYQRYCRERGLSEHPARFPAGIPAFFIRMLTDRGDLVVDPFAGSCVTGAVAQSMGRRWLCLESELAYVEGAKGRFESSDEQPAAPGVHSHVLVTREGPYGIYPPWLSILDEDSSPLAEDGGEKRSSQM
ncbi:MAG TPA: site-specific DNA-methyltransferase [Anaerolineae bacterium]|nr:site-specific DNA-methyltransferase [Anaerolineae bacterium]